MEERLDLDRRLPRYLNGRLLEERTRRALSGMQILLISADRHISSSARTGRNGEFKLAVPQQNSHIRVWYSMRIEVRDTARQRLGSFRLRDVLTSGNFLDIAVRIMDNSDDPYIILVTPTVVFPGSFVEIRGLNFGENYGEVTVTVGGREALVLDHDPQQLLVRIPPLPGDLNPLIVTVGSENVVYQGTLEYGVLPFSGDPGSSGPPMTFIGSQDTLE